jgi:uncharacterized membrane protein
MKALVCIVLFGVLLLLGIFASSIAHSDVPVYVLAVPAVTFFALAFYFEWAEKRQPR